MFSFFKNNKCDIVSASDCSLAYIMLTMKSAAFDVLALLVCIADCCSHILRSPGRCLQVVNPWAHIH